MCCVVFYGDDDVFTCMLAWYVSCFCGGVDVV